MAKKHVDPIKAKQKKQKIIAAVLGVLFLGLLAFQVPRVMKQLNPPPPPVAAPSTTTGSPTSGTPTLAAPTLGGAEQPASNPGGTATPAGAPVVQDGQLASFSLFASKDPFAQQLSEDTGSPTASSGSSGSSGSSSSSGSGGTGSSGGGVPNIPGNQPSPGSAVISVNGTLYSVAVGTDFPTSTDPTLTPLFHLISLTAHSAKISIVGGSYANGAGAVWLKENKAVTLMNTADGTRYRLILKPQGTSLPGEGESTSTTPTTVTLPPATP
jgi:hypothetical protein